MIKKIRNAVCSDERLRSLIVVEDNIIYFSLTEYYFILNKALQNNEIVDPTPNL